MADSEDVWKGGGREEEECAEAGAVSAGEYMSWAPAGGGARADVSFVGSNRMGCVRKRAGHFPPRDYGYHPCHLNRGLEFSYIYTQALTILSKS